MDDIRKLVAANNPNQAKEGTAKIASFNRSVIRVKLETDGTFVVSVVDSMETLYVHLPRIMDVPE